LASASVRRRSTSLVGIRRSPLSEKTMWAISPRSHNRFTVATERRDRQANSPVVRNAGETVLVGTVRIDLIFGFRVGRR
jgi:hypothetical protein